MVVLLVWQYGHKFLESNVEGLLCSIMVRNFSKSGNGWREEESRIRERVSWEGVAIEGLVQIEGEVEEKERKLRAG